MPNRIERGVLDAAIAISSDLSLDSVLSRIVRTACELVDARFAALGVLTSTRDDSRRLRTFIHHGMDDEQVVRIGELPRGHGLLGHIIDEPRPLRLHDIAEHAESYGFPAHHPPMTSFLGVPIRVRDKVFGNLYLTEKAGGTDFTEQDETVVVALASAAGAAIENARLYEEAHRREQWLAASADITTRLVGDPVEGDPLQLVADRARGVADADVAWIATRSGADGADQSPVRLRVVSGERIDIGHVAHVDLNGSLTNEVFVTGEPVTWTDVEQRVDSENPVPGAVMPPLGAVIAVPLRSPRRVEGVLALAWAPERDERCWGIDIALPVSFAEQASLALEIARAREDHERLAVLEDRDRIGRDLHDLVIQRLFAVCLSLESTTRRTAETHVAERLTSAVDELDGTIRDIRRSIFALATPEDAEDIQSEITRLVDRARASLKVRTTVTFHGPVRTLISASVAPDLLAVLGEALSNAARHASADQVDVVVSAGAAILLQVHDDGVGIPDQVVESGLRNIAERAARHGGTTHVARRDSGGTTLSWSVPAAATP
ncbi:GAF domain-containing sensor histidine kinase [Nocardioides sp. R-C-SC26]|uniref:sensor histidine kinase n=1 Tax=Nocardioides sp. R-C-SC26 TaxID=2870414 RepID=UPI001E41FD07|nr:GAF domain-containing sensor histidine kinase [Nocardioides sp. R-C-SC26]